MNDKKRLKEKEKLLNIFFERPESEQVKGNEHYRHVIFNHVGFLMPYFGSIYEQVGNGLGVPQESADRYLPDNCIMIILPIKLDERVRKIMKKNVGQYSNCVHFVINVLIDLKILPKDYKRDGVDELFMSLSKYRIKTKRLVKLNGGNK